MKIRSWMLAVARASWLTFWVADFIRGGKAERFWGESYYTSQGIESILQEAGFGKVATEFVRGDVVLVSSLKVKLRTPDEQAGKSLKQLLGF